MQGHGTFQYKDGSKYVGLFLNNLKDGEGEFINSDNLSEYFGHWSNDM